MRLHLLELLVYRHLELIPTSPFALTVLLMASEENDYNLVSHEQLVRTGL